MACKHRKTWALEGMHAMTRWRAMQACQCNAHCRVLLTHLADVDRSAAVPLGCHQEVHGSLQAHVLATDRKNTTGWGPNRTRT